MGTQKNRLNETVLLGTQNICLDCWERKYLLLYAQTFCLHAPGPINYNDGTAKNENGIGPVKQVFAFMYFTININRLIDTVFWGIPNVCFG